MAAARRRLRSALETEPGQYRRACKLPAYVLVTNRKHKNAIHIPAAAFMAAPTEVQFADASGITDRPDAEVLL